jgi:hypothetical protein
VELGEDDDYVGTCYGGGSRCFREDGSARMGGQQRWCLMCLSYTCSGSGAYAVAPQLARLSMS